MSIQAHLAELVRRHQALDSEIAEALQQRHGAFVQVERRRVPEALGLLADRVGDLGMAVAHAYRENAAEEIQKFFAISIVDVIVLRVIDNQRLVIVGRNAGKKIFFLFFNNFVFVHQNLFTV